MFFAQCITALQNVKALCQLTLLQVLAEGFTGSASSLICRCNNTSWQVGRWGQASTRARAAAAECLRLRRLRPR